MSTTFLSDRAVHYPENPIRGLSWLALQAEANGVTVLPLNIGAPDIFTPYEIRLAGSEFLKNTPAIRYGSSVGDLEAIQRLKIFYKNKEKLPFIDSLSMMITQGASEALELVLYTIGDMGDVVLTPDPCYSNYRAIAYKNGIRLSPIPTTIDDGFHIINKNETFDQAVNRIEKLITPKTKAFLWSSPGNPTGTIFSQAELKVFLTLSRKHNLFIISDEVYRILAFENTVNQNKIARSPSILDIVEQKDFERLIVLDSASKMLSFCGARIGILLASQVMVENLVKQASVRGCPNTIGQASLKGIDSVPVEYFNNARKEFRLRRDVLYKGLMSLKSLGVSVSENPPEGAFYIVANLGKINAENFCKWLLTKYPKRSGRKETIFLTPMKMCQGGFYLRKDFGENEVRITYVLKASFLKKAVSILENALVLYKKLYKIQ